MQGYLFQNLPACEAGPGGVSCLPARQWGSFYIIIYFGGSLFHFFTLNYKARRLDQIDFFAPQEPLTIGANYWASHAGPAMWSDWRPDIVEQDFKKLSEAGIKLLRVFPIWPDFQPLNLLLTGDGVPKVIQVRGKPSS